MSKVDINARPAVIPPEYFSQLKPSTGGYEQLLKIVPLQSTVTSATTTVKTIVELPAINFRLNDIIIEVAMTANFSSNNGSDNFGTVLPALCRWGSSLINRVRLTVGTFELINQYYNNTRYAWQQNMMSNAISRLTETYNNVSPVAFANSTTTQIFRFPLTAFPNDFLSLESGIFPGKHLLKTNLELYWEVPANCMYAQGAILGTVFSFSYNITNYTLQVIQISDPSVDSLISSRGLITNYVEWFGYQIGISTAASQSIQIPLSYRSVRCLVFGVQKNSDMTSLTNGAKLYGMSSELSDIQILNIRVNSTKRMQDDLLTTGQAIAETRRAIPVSKFADYYQTPSTNSNTTQLLAFIVGQNYCVSCLSGLNTQNLNSQMYLIIQCIKFHFDHDGVCLPR
jgi:hypothetical protein